MWTKRLFKLVLWLLVALGLCVVVPWFYKTFMEIEEPRAVSDRKGWYLVLCAGILLLFLALGGALNGRDRKSSWSVWICLLAGLTVCWILYPAFVR